MKGAKIAGVSFNFISWALILTSVVFSWLTYSNLKNADSTIPVSENQLKTAVVMMLVISIIASIALFALTVSITSYTLRFKEMGPVAATLFFFEWILIAAAVVSLWLAPSKIEIYDEFGNDIGTLTAKYQLAAAVTSTVALGLFTIYYLMEIFPYIAKQETKKVTKRSTKA